MRKKLLPAYMALMTLFACDADLKVSVPEFRVTCLQTEISPGDTVCFVLNGNPQYVSFWSGEKYSDWSFREDRILTPGWESELLFSSELTNGIDKGNLCVLASNDFDGNYSELDDKDWVNITGRFTIADSPDKVSSSIQSLIDFVSDEPLYLAFRYKSAAEYGVAPRWVISDLAVRNHLATGELVTMYDIHNSGFRLVETEGDSKAVVSDTQLILQGPDIVAESEHWIVSGPMYLKKSWSIGGDRPVAIKGFAEQLPGEYKYVYGSPGIYNAVFVASNQTISSCGETVKSVRIVVNE